MAKYYWYLDRSDFRDKDTSLTYNNVLKCKLPGHLYDFIESYRLILSSNRNLTEREAITKKFAVSVNALIQLNQVFPQNYKILEQLFPILITAYRFARMLTADPNKLLRIIIAFLR